MELANPAAFFNELRRGLLGPTLAQSEVDGLSAILSACGAWCMAWVAYGLATAYHETAHTMQPVKEIGGEAYFTRMYDPKGLRPWVAEGLGNTRPGDGALFAGRGYAQLTGRKNYDRADRALDLHGELLVNPDLALRSDIAAQIMRRGMEEGWFTGRKLADYLRPDARGTRAQFIECRRIINGSDRAEMIADYAVAFQAALVVGVWGGAS